MTIIQRGIIEDDRAYRFRCKFCGCIWDDTMSSNLITYRDPLKIGTRCPECGKAIMFHKDTDFCEQVPCEGASVYHD